MCSHFEYVLISTISQDPTLAFLDLIPHSKQHGYKEHSKFEAVMVAPNMNSEDASAKDVLQQCARNLVNVAQQLQSCDRVTQTSQMDPTENRQTYVLQEHRALFGFVPPSGGQTRSSTNSRETCYFHAIWPYCYSCQGHVYQTICLPCRQRSDDATKCPRENPTLFCSTW